MIKRRSLLRGIGAGFGATIIAPIASPILAPGLADDRAARADTRDPTHHRVVITDFEFVPSVLTVRPGDVVTWVNLDIAPHTATARDGAWDTEGLDTNEEATVAVRAGMATDYFCAFHPMMKGKLRIVEA